MIYKKIMGVIIYMLFKLFIIFRKNDYLYKYIFQ